VHRNYLVWLKDVDFQGGVSFDLKFNAEVVLKRGFVAWGRNGKFLDPLAQCIEGAVKGWALAVNATEFIGKTESGLVDAQTAKETSERLRRELRDSILAINKDTNMGGGGGDPVLLESLCGYEIISVSYNDIQPSNDESKLRLKVLEQQNEAILKTIIAEQDVKTAKAEAEAAAAKLTGPGMAKVAIEKAAGLADAEVMRAKKEAVGAELMVTEFNATALRDTKVTTLVLGGGGVPSVILPLPSTSSPKPDAATPTANPSPAPATGK
jgi:regulator of protease activity HflC (stomatin/prohibitin superfamily)